MPENASHFDGFHSYADGTPRREDFEPTSAPAMAYWRDTSAYLDGGEAPRGPPADWRRMAAVAGVAATVAAATTFVWTSLGRREAEPPAPAASADTSGMHVVVTEPPPPPALPRAARLDVLPARPAPSGVHAPTAPAAPSQEVAPVAPRTASHAAPHHASRALRPAPAPRNNFNNCRDAPTAARRMVCSDMRIAAADQGMKQAFAAAMAAGVPYRRLNRDQQAWLQAREHAARGGRSAMLDIYRQRTDALWAQARARN